MSYATWLATAFGKRGVWLYELTYGSTTVRLAASASNISALSNTWTASSIAHQRFRQTSAIGRAETILTLPNSDSFAQSLLTTDLQDTTVILRHGFTEDSASEFAVRFRGRMVGVRPLLGTIAILCENRFTETGRKGLSAVIQRPCRHALYHSKDGLGCGVDYDTFKSYGTLVALSGNVAEVTEASGQADGYYAGGILEYNGRRQLIVKHEGYNLTLLGPVAGMATDLASASSLSVYIAPGCDLTRATCNSRFNNLANFGGFPWIKDSPFAGKTLF